jgi:nitrate reductase NapE
MACRYHEDYIRPVNAETAMSERSERRREWGVFLVLAFGLAPVIAVLTVATFGFAIWIYQMIAGPPGPPPP